MSIDRKQLLQTLKKPFKSFNGAVDQELIDWLTHFRGDVENTILFLNAKYKIHEDNIQKDGPQMIFPQNFR